MKKALEILAVMLMVLSVISMIAVVYHQRVSNASAAPGSIDDEVTSTVVVEGMP